MKKLIIFLIPIFFIGSCVSPSNLTAPKDFMTHVKGLYVECETSNGIVNGEIIEVTPKAIVIMTSEKSLRMVNIPASKIRNIEIIVSGTSDSPKQIATHSSLNCLSSAGHGYFGFYSLPINLIVGIGVTQDAYKGSYRIRYPKEVHWDQLFKFARFPQGIPPGFDFNRMIMQEE